MGPDPSKLRMTGYKFGKSLAIRRISIPEKLAYDNNTRAGRLTCHTAFEQLMALSVPSSWSSLPPVVFTGGHIMCKVQYTIFQPTGLCSFPLLPKSTVDASLAMLGLLHERTLFAIKLYLTPGAAVVHTCLHVMGFIHHLLKTKRFLITVIILCLKLLAGRFSNLRNCLVDQCERL